MIQSQWRQVEGVIRESLLNHGIPKDAYELLLVDKDMYRERERMGRRRRG